MSRLGGKFRYLWVGSAVVTTVTATVGAFMAPSESDKQVGALVEEMKALWEREEQMEEEFMRNTSYPSKATSRDIENINKVTAFERANGFCHIYFIHAESNGSHYRVNDEFWINERQRQTNRDFLEEFTTILEVPNLSSICRAAGYSGKVLVKNRGDKKWIYSSPDQSKAIFTTWANPQKS
ncbi:hypothetical protein HF1_05400 [Mycoplasma haemofelis str. Langford 1]|uniref:Uncharacterized protein n=1 Tax=Mycoplasma haemofelis (strain Langford 1) TaxID=941640 RepID=E8ZHC7_MYCHL|nr:hypothetical protein [Mycoplasma haemofelis]CBY92548.1 hypothetical protein HF1_05400 [Mycoplasma haemofelis str. Langford 1]